MGTFGEDEGWGLRPWLALLLTSSSSGNHKGSRFSYLSVREGGSAMDGVGFTSQARGTHGGHDFLFCSQIFSDLEGTWVSLGSRSLIRL